MPAKGRNWTGQISVVGLRFRWKKDARRALADLIEHKGTITGIRIEREPDNEYDENALAVYLPERLMSGRQLGYVPREVAEVLAHALDDGRTTIVRAELNSLDPDDDWNTGQMTVYFLDPHKSPAKKGKSRA